MSQMIAITIKTNKNKRKRTSLEDYQKMCGVTVPSINTNNKTNDKTNSYANPSSNSISSTNTDNKTNDKTNSYANPSSNSISSTNTDNDSVTISTIESVDIPATICCTTVEPTVEPTVKPTVHITCDTSAGDVVDMIKRCDAYRAHRLNVFDCIPTRGGGPGWGRVRIVGLRQGQVGLRHELRMFCMMRSGGGISI